MLSIVLMAVPFQVFGTVNRLFGGGMRSAVLVAVRLGASKELVRMIVSMVLFSGGIRPAQFDTDRNVEELGSVYIWYRYGSGYFFSGCLD